MKVECKLETVHNICKRTAYVAGRMLEQMHWKPGQFLTFAFSRLKANHCLFFTRVPYD